MTDPQDHPDEQLVRMYMRRLAALPVSPGARDPMPLWWKAQLLKRWDAERRVQKPLDVVERVEIGAGLAAAALLLVWIAPQLLRIFG